MPKAFIDTSWLTAIAFEEPHADQLSRRLREQITLAASPLLEAEFRSACRRESVDVLPDALTLLQWITPDRPLTKEINQVLSAGYLKGAACWHLACALFLSPDPSELLFLTLDARQREVAGKLGFQLADL